MKCSKSHRIYVTASAYNPLRLSCYTEAEIQYKQHRNRRKKIPERHFKMPALWMQIVDLCIDLPAASRFPSIHASISLLSWRYHPSSHSYQFISRRSSFPISAHLHSAPLQSYSPVKMITPARCTCVCLCVCVCTHFCICARKDICLANGQRKRLSVL